MGTPVTGGNVSFYNQTGDVAILPTPVVGVLGVVDDVTRRVKAEFAHAGDRVLLLGTTRDELDGSEWAHEVHGHLGGKPPVVDLEAERALGALLHELVAGGLVTASHDVSDGGVAQTLVEMALRSDQGAQIELANDTAARFVELFSESVARAVVTVSDAERVIALASTHGVPVRDIGVVGGDALAIDGAVTVSLSTLREAHERTLPALFDHSAD
jgi:phosphoribosylformylglycinamidine synthase